MPSTKPNISFAGLGAMGGGMAKNLVKNGYQVTGFDISSKLLDDFVQAGGKSSKTPKEAASSADFLISMVANADQNSSFLFSGPDSAIQGLGQSKTLVICSTVSPDFLPQIRKRLDEEFNRPDIHLLDCPVSGGTLRAAEGSLSIFASGPDPALDSAWEILTSMSANLYRMSGGISSGSATKAVHQLLAATNIISVSEALGLAATVGLNTSKVASKIVEGSEGEERSKGASFMFSNRAPHMIRSDWHPYSALGIILKDTGIVTSTARKISFPTPLAAVAEQQYLAGVSAGLLLEDDAALVKLYLPEGQPELVGEMAAKADEKMTESFRVNAGTVEDLLRGIHLAAAVEAMGFCKAMGLDRGKMCEIVLKAAGWSAAFEEFIPDMLEKDSWSLADCSRAQEVGQCLDGAVEKCREIGYPCPMASIALTRFASAGLRDKKIQGLDRKSR